ncbi:hypothetical protein [Paenibacillus hamazuiensis]|uniref:hypothetical protein n=1 Tax=Paenibacillus hamazuiensis TaxID=2936508 RepID=UPI00200D1013|nr:hypothetical protein [Paenibacillus hamazuiensis]
MSRKWERMVQKNTKHLNKQRVKVGKKPLSGASSDEGVTIRGRSWFFPVILIAVGIFCFISFRGLAQQDNMYWITGGCYILLGIFTYLVRRPYLKIGKKELSTRRFSGVRTLEAADIKQITLMKNAFIIEGKQKNARWIFSQFYHLMDMGQAAAQLREFAKTHAVPLKDEV